MGGRAGLWIVDQLSQDDARNYGEDVPFSKDFHKEKMVYKL